MSTKIQNTILAKTLRCQVNSILGSKDTIEMLSAIGSADAEVLETPIMQYIDFFWKRYKYHSWALNSIYIVYPLFLMYVLLIAEEDYHESTHYTLMITTMPVLLEFC